MSSTILPFIFSFKLPEGTDNTNRIGYILVMHIQHTANGDSNQREPPATTAATRDAAQTEKA